MRSLSVYYPLVVAGCVDPNEMLQNNQASTLLVLLMIAQGAAAMPMAEARYLSAGLTETCRISSSTSSRRTSSSPPTPSPCAAPSSSSSWAPGAATSGSWTSPWASADAYISMLKHAGMLEPQPSMIPAFSNSTSAEIQWRSWLHRESQNRYSPLRSSDWPGAISL